MEWETILWELVQMIENAAPKAWAIALKQVEVMAYVASVWGILFGVLAILLSIGMILGMLHESRRGRVMGEMGNWTPLIFIIIPALLIFVMKFLEVKSMSINPEYYAIETLINLLQFTQ